MIFLTVDSLIVRFKVLKGGLFFHASNVLWETFEQAFSAHGDIEEGAVITDKATGKSRGYGFITYRHMESAQRALQEPSKLIDVRNIMNANRKLHVDAVNLVNFVFSN